MTDTKHLLVGYNYPMKVVQKNQNTTLELKTKDRIWYSQPRSDKDNSWEILRINLRQPILITDISFSILDRPCFYEIWVTSKGIKTTLLTSDLKQVSGRILGGKIASGQKVGWKSIVAALNPTTVTQIEIRMRRNSAVGVGAVVSMGIRDFLVRRTVREQSDTLFSLRPETDILGNPTRKVVQDWDAELAHDDNSFTFWKSGPQPAKNAVVNFYTTVGDGIKPERVDRLWIDPVYTGQHLNVYYSTDPIVGTITPKPKRIKSTLTGTTIVIDSGVDLNSSGKSYSINTPSLLSRNTVPMPGLGTTGWIGLEFEIASGLAGSGSTTVFSNPAVTDFSLKFNYTTKVFTFANNAGAHTTSKVTSPAKPFTSGDRIQCVMTVSKNLTNNQVTLRLIVAVSGTVVSDTSSTSLTNDTLEKLYTGSSQLLFNQKIGYLRHLIISVGADIESQYQSFIVDSNSFLNPNMNVHRQGSNFLLQGNLDNSILVGSYVSGDDAYGGIGSELYENKIWKPIWKNWTVQRGFYYLPRPIAACHIKLEFSNLTEQPYPIYETGISVPYKVYPPSLKNKSSRVFTSDSVAPSNEALNVQTKPSARSTLSLSSEPKTHIVFGSKVVGEIRNRYNYDYRTLVSETTLSSSLKTSASSQPYDLVKSTIAHISKPSANVASSDSDHKALPLNNVIGSLKINPDVKRLSGAKTPTWWYLPGGLKVPAETMVRLIDSQTVLESEDLLDRPRFPTDSVHEYETAYAVRSGVAYFAGIREFQVFRLDHTAPVDAEAYELIDYASEAEASENMSLGSPDDDSGTYPAIDPLETGGGLMTDPGLETMGPLPGGMLATATLKTWASIGTFTKIKIDSVDRGFHSDTQGFPIEPLGLDNDGAFWDDTTAMWSDTVATWGSDSALVGIDFESDFYFAGRQASKVYRFAGVGVAGVQTKIFDSVAGERQRMCFSIYRPEQTGNDIKVQLIDVTPITGSVLREEVIDVQIGRWQLFKTDFAVVDTPLDMLRIRLIMDGLDEETIYLGELYDEGASIVYNVSNNGGDTWIEATRVINEPNAYLVFPKPGNQLKVKVDMYDHRDYAHTLTVKPTYLF